MKNPDDPQPTPEWSWPGEPAATEPTIPESIVLGEN